MWNGNGKTFPFPSTENNLKAVIIKGQKHIIYQNNIKLIENAKSINSSKNNESVNINISRNKKCGDRIAIDMELLMQKKKCIAHHSA